MKKIFLLLFLFILSIYNQSLAQDESKKWEFGISLGVNSLDLKKKESGYSLTVFTSQNSNAENEKRQFSFQGYAIVKYSINRRFQVLGNIGILYAKDVAFKQSTRTTTLLGVFETIRLDTVNQEYKLLDIPISIRWNIIATDNKFWKIKPFMDLGLSIKIPLTQETYFGREVNRYENPWIIGPTTTTTTYSSGKLKVEPPFVYFAIGFLVGKKTSLAFSISGINTHAVGNSNIYFSSLLKSLRVTRFF